MHSGLTFHVTRHCALRLAERSVLLENVKDVVKYADEEKRLQRGGNGGILRRFEKTVEGRKLVVIAEIKNNDCWLATAYYEY
jgi:hypothetical protein